MDTSSVVESQAGSMKVLVPDVPVREDSWTIKPFRARPPRLVLPPVVEKM